MRGVGIIYAVIVGSATTVLAQSHDHTTARPAAPHHHARSPSGLPLMRTPATASPWQTFQHLRKGNEMLIQASSKDRARIQPRPFGPGRRIAAVFVPTGLPHATARLFSVRHRDLLVMSSPLPTVRNEEVLRLEYAVEHEQVRLLVILVNRTEPRFLQTLSRQPAKTQAKAQDQDPILARRMQKNLNAANALAQREHISVPAAYGMLQVDAVWMRSRLLEQRRLQGRFEIALGLVDAQTGAIDWVTKWHKRWQLVSSASARQRQQLWQQQRIMAAAKQRQAPAKREASGHPDAAKHKGH